MSCTRDYFDWHYKISSFFLLISPKRIIWRVLYWIVAIPHLALICFSPFMELAALCFGGSGDFSADILTFGLIVLHLMGASRVVGWFFIKKDIEIVIERVKKINLHFSLFDCPYSKIRGRRLLDIISISNPIEDFREKKMHQTKLFCLKLFVGFVFYVAVNIMVSYALTYHNPTYEKWNPALNKTSVYRDYPYKLWFPFDLSISDGYYLVGFLYQPYAFFFLIGGFFCSDSLGINIIIHLTAHVNILGYAFRHIDTNIDPYLNFKAAMKLKEKKIIKCMQQLQEIYRCAKMLNDIFTSQLLIQELSLAIVLCCAVYRVTTVTVGPEFGYLSSIVIVCVIEGFTLSWFNQNFTLEVFELIDCVYELDWINYPPKLRKVLVFLMTRLQKPFYFTMGSWQPININVFLKTIKASYSLYTLITGSRVNKSAIHGKTI